MPVDIDGYAVLAAIGGAPQAFPALQAEIVKTARTLVVKQLKDRGLTIGGLVAMAAALGPEAFDLVADALSDAEIKSLLTKVDKQNLVVKAAAPPAQRHHFAALAAGAVAPSSLPGPPRSAKPKPSSPPVERAGNSKAMRATRKT